MLRRIAIVAAVSVTLVACEKDPVKTSSTNNPDISVSLLFKYEGCSVYRFRDDGVYVYYTDCQGSTQAQYTEYCGKGCYRAAPIFNQTFRHP